MSLSHRVTELIENWLGNKDPASVDVKSISAGNNTIGSVKLTDGTDEVDVIDANGEKGLVVVSPNHISTDNSTTTILMADATFTGVAENIINYSDIQVLVKASHVSSIDGLEIQISPDGINWDSTDCYTIVAETGKIFSVPCFGSFFRIRYTNGGTNQTYFRLQSKLISNYSKPSSHRIGDNISAEDDAELSKTVLTAQRTDNDMFVPIKASNSNNLRITNAEDGLAIAKGEVNGTSFIHKFGNAPDFDTGDGEITVWDGADNSGINVMNYTFSTSAIIDSLSSSSQSDIVEITIEGLDSNYDFVSQDITLNGQTRVSLSTDLIRVNRMYNSGVNDIVGEVYCFENVSLSSGVPTDTSKIKAIINNGNNQTLMAVYTIPNNVTGYLRSWYASTSGASKNTEYVFKIKSRETGKVFRVIHVASISDQGTTSINHIYIEPQRFLEKTDIIIEVTSQALGSSGCAVSAGFDLVLVDD